MVKKIVIAAAAFYLLGVFGVSGGYLSEAWNGEWATTDQLVTAISAGLAWPAMIFDLAVGG